MFKSILLLFCFFFVGCGKPLAPYNYKDAIIIKKSIMHKELGNLAQKTMNEITEKRQLLKSGTISSEDYRIVVQKIKDLQQSAIIKIQRKYDKYVKDNKQEEKIE